MRVFAAALAFVVLGAATATAGKLDVAYASMERMIVSKFLTEGGRRYLQGGPEETCAYAFIQEPRVSSIGARLELRFLFAGRAGKQVGSKCVGAGDNFDIVVSGVPRYADGDLFLDEAKFESEHKLFEVFSKLIERQLAPLLRIRANPHVESFVAQLTSRGAGTVRLETMDIQSIELGASSAVIEADFVVTVKP